MQAGVILSVMVGSYHVKYLEVTIVTVALHIV